MIIEKASLKSESAPAERYVCFWHIALRWSAKHHEGADGYKHAAPPEQNGSVSM